MRLPESDPGPERDGVVDTIHRELAFIWYDFRGSGTPGLQCYRRYIGQLDDEDVTLTTVYVGGGLTLAGMTIALMGWAGFLVSTLSLEYGTAQFWLVRKLLITAVGIGAPAFLFGSVVLFLGRSGLSSLAGIGAILSVLAMVIFVTSYPSSWDTADSVSVPLAVTLYGLGLLGMTFTTGAAFSCRILN